METPGVQPVNLIEELTDEQVSKLLPNGVYGLLNTISPDLVNSPERAETLSRALSVELAVTDSNRRRILLSAIPERKIAELEDRTKSTINQLFEPITQHTEAIVMGFLGHPKNVREAEDVTPSISSISPERGLFQHQKLVACEAERYLYRENGRVMVHLPTGIGKTRTAMSIVASHLRSIEQGLVIWLAATEELLEQAISEFELTWQSIGDREVECTRFWSHHKPNIGDIRDGILIAGLAKLHSFGRDRRQLWELGDRTTMVVFDEAHQAIAHTYRDLIETIVTRNPRTGLLGLTATPGRTWSDSQTDSTVADLFYGNKVTINFPGENPVVRLTREGYLAEVSFSLLNVNPGLTLSEDDLLALSNSLDIPDELARRLGDDDRRNLRILQRLLELSKEHKRILMFAPSVQNALLITSACRGVGLDANAITSSTNKSDRRKLISRFKRLDGQTRILINYGVLTTGFDAPQASAALIARPTKSLVLYSQMVGRVIRGPRAGGTESCEIVTVVDTTLHGFGDIAEAFMNWEDIWNVE